MKRTKRKLKTRDKRSKRKRVALAVFWVIVLACLIGAGWHFPKLLVRSVWDGTSRINFVFETEPISLVSFTPEGKLLAFLVIPDGTYIEAIHGYGPYRVESLYQLGELEGRGSEVLAGSLQEYLAVPIDGWVAEGGRRSGESVVTGAPVAKWEIGDGEEARDLVARVLLQYLRSGGETNFTRWDLLRLWWQIRRVREDKITTVDLGQTSASQRVDLPDGSQATRIDPDRLNSIISRLFIDEKIRAEDLALVVLNDTDHSGLAHRGARIISNIGGRVVGTGEAEDGNEKCRLKSGRKDRDSYTVKKTAAIFNCQWTGEGLEGQRADVVLILGDDYWRRLYSPW